MVRALDDGYAGEGAEQRLKVPPNSIEAEQALIGGLMLNAQAWDRVADVVSSVDFYRKDHRLIFQAIGNLIEDGSPCDECRIGKCGPDPVEGTMNKLGSSSRAGGIPTYLGPEQVMDGVGPWWQRNFLILCLVPRLRFLLM